MTHKRLRQCLDDLARAIDRGEVDPAPLELEALLAIAMRQGDQQSADRLRRWMAVSA